jgi:hypothetical protein
MTMLNSETMEKLRGMKLRGMAEAFRNQEGDSAVAICPLKNALEYWWTRNGELGLLLRFLSSAFFCVSVFGVRSTSPAHAPWDIFHKYKLATVPYGEYPFPFSLLLMEFGRMHAERPMPSASAASPYAAVFPLRRKHMPAPAHAPDVKNERSVPPLPTLRRA